jgi:hypothetical protein
MHNDDHTETVESLKIKNQLLLELLETRQAEIFRMQAEYDNSLARIMGLHHEMEKVLEDSLKVPKKSV